MGSLFVCVRRCSPYDNITVMLGFTSTSSRNVSGPSQIVQSPIILCRNGVEKGLHGAPNSQEEKVVDLVRWVILLATNVPHTLALVDTGLHPPVVLQQ